MNRLRLVLLGVVGFGAIAATLFIVENQVRGLRESLQEIHHQIHADREAIHVMQAEWAYLTQPQRIAQLVKENMPELTAQQSSQYYSEKAAILALDHAKAETESASAEQ